MGSLASCGGFHASSSAGWSRTQARRQIGIFFFSQSRKGAENGIAPDF